MNRDLKSKSYNQVMNEWAAQKQFLRRAAGGIFHPGRNIGGRASIAGWLWRGFLITFFPFLAYLLLLRWHGKSAGFKTQLAGETRRFLDAGTVTFQRVRWDLNGDLRVERMDITGAPQNFFTSARIKNLATSVPVPGVFRDAWKLDRVACTDATITLRTGVGSTFATAATSGTLAAGWGINPDFSRLSIGSYTVGNLTLQWGGPPATRGGITDSRATLTLKGDARELALTGGTFSQCWLEGLKVGKALVRIAGGRADISRADFSIPGGGGGYLTGDITLGENPEITGTLTLENIPLHQYISEYFQNYVKALGKGTIKLSGSTNRATGIRMEGDIVIQSGSISSIPVLLALEKAVSEPGLSTPSITGGRVQFISEGTAAPRSLAISAEKIILDCGTRLKLALSFTHEHKQVLAANVYEAVKNANQSASDAIATSTKGTLQIGLPPATAGKLKASIREAFISREEQGLQWLDIPFNLDKGQDFTKEAADKIYTLLYAKP